MGDGGRGQPASSRRWAVQVHMFTLHTGAAGRGDGYQCGLNWGRSSYYDVWFGEYSLRLSSQWKIKWPIVCVWWPGGIFLATGSSDAVVRVYSFVGAVPEKIGELEAHTVSLPWSRFAHWVHNCIVFSAMLFFKILCEMNHFVGKQLANFYGCLFIMC